MDLPPPVRLAAKTSAERRSREKVSGDSTALTKCLQKKKEGESLFLLSLAKDGSKISDEMNPILGMYKMPTPAYYLRGCFPMGDLKCIMKCNSKDVPIQIPSHMDRIVREWIRDGILEWQYGPPLEKKKGSVSKGPPKDFKEVPVWQYDSKGAWSAFNAKATSVLEDAWQEEKGSVELEFEDDVFDVRLCGENEMKGTNRETKAETRIRRLPGSPIYPTMPQGTRVEVLYKKQWYPGYFDKHDGRRYKIQCDSDKKGIYTDCNRKELRRMGREGLPDLPTKKKMRETKEKEDGATKDGDDDAEKDTRTEEEKKIDADKKLRAEAVVDTDFDFDFFWVVSDVSPIIKKHYASIWNLVHHPWSFPQVTLGSPDFVNTIPMGLFTTLNPKTCCVEEAKQKNGLTMNELCFMKVYVHKHPKDDWAMCCSPDNAAFRVNTKKPFSFFWSAAIMGLPDPPEMKSKIDSDDATKPTFSEAKNLVKYNNSCFTSPNQIIVHNAKLWRKEESLRILRGRPKPNTGGKTEYKDPSWTGLYFDRMGNDCSITFDCVESRPFRGTMIRGGNKTLWKIQYSDDDITYVTVKAFSKTLTRGWDCLDWDDVGSHRYWRYACVDNPDSAIDFYKGVEWYELKKENPEDGGKKKKKCKPRVCVSLQWVLHKKNPKLSQIFDDSKNLSELLTALNDHFGKNSDIMYDVMYSLGKLTEWKASAAVQKERAEFAKSVKKSRGFHASKSGRVMPTYSGWSNRTSYYYSY